MGAELGEQAIQVTTKLAITSITELVKLIEALTRARDTNSKNSIVHGQQTLKKLNLQNKKLESITLTDDNIKDFRKQLNRYAVDFHIMQDKGTGQYTIFFKGQDIDRIYMALENSVKGLSIDRSSKKPIKMAIESALLKAGAHPSQHKAHQKDRASDRGHER